MRNLVGCGKRHAVDATDPRNIDLTERIDDAVLAESESGFEMKPAEGRKRVIIEEIRPQVDCGRYPAKRTLGDTVTITAAVFGDGHDHVAGHLLYRHESESDWHSTPLTPLSNDLWSASFAVDKLGYWHYTIEAWIDHFETWCADLHKRIDAQPKNGNTAPSQEIPLALWTGVRLLEEALPRVRSQSIKDANLIEQVALSLRWLADQDSVYYDYPLSDECLEIVARHPDLTLATRYSQDLLLWIDRERASYSSWYELFPRSTSPDLSRHGTFADVEALVPSIAAMGFDVLYLPPIHPIGSAYRKGRNNTVTADAGDPGSPWAIGSAEGGHKAIHPQLGTFEDFNHLLVMAQSYGMEIALNAHPTIPGSQSTRSGSTFAPTAPSSMRKIRRRSIRISIPSTSNPKGGKLSGRPSATSSSSGSATVCASSASTTRTQKLCLSGSGVSPRSIANTLMSSSSPKPSRDRT
jgi:hypothetical protein